MAWCQGPLEDEADRVRANPNAFPRALWAYGACRAEIIGPPTCPPDGEQIVDVPTLPAAKAVEFLETRDPMMADAVRLAIAMELV
jgi:8-oxo-dGTP diphosphatase